ncbi:MAG: trypsin-like peptidase domain-containing protein, partial [Cuspidothrix sp.]
MKLTYRLTAALITSTIILVQPQNLAALENNEINNIAKQIIVRIDGVNQGTGVIVNKQGNTYTVLTNRHVVQLPGNYTLQTPDGQPYTFNSSQVKQLPNLDLAVLQFNSNKNYSYAKLGDSSKLTETTPIYIGGWGVKDAFCLERCYRFSDGKIISISPQSKDGYSLIYSNPVKQGMSGGPVLNAQGELVGINGNSFTDPNTGITDFAGIPINEYKVAVGIGNKVDDPPPSPTTNNAPARNLARVDYSKFDLVRTLSGHSGDVTSVAISADGQTLVSGSGDNTIKIWNLGTGQLIRTLSGHSERVRSVAISPDGKTLASGSDDDTIKIWNLGTGQLIRTLSGHSAGVWSVAISPDGRTLASLYSGSITSRGTVEHIIGIWNLATGELIHTLSSYSKGVAISPDGNTLASDSYDRAITIWNLATGELIRTLSGNSAGVNSVAISPDGRTLAGGSDDDTIKIWNLGTGQLIRTLSGHSHSVFSVAISADGQTLVSGSYDKTIKIWNRGTGQLIRTLSGHASYVSSVAISADGQTLVS